MIKNPCNKNAYSEVYDADAIEELAKMAFYDICIEEGCKYSERPEDHSRWTLQRSFLRHLGDFEADYQRWNGTPKVDRDLTQAPMFFILERRWQHAN